MKILNTFLIIENYSWKIDRNCMKITTQDFVTLNCPYT